MGTHLPGPTVPKPCYVRQSHLVLGALPSAVPCARLHARLVLAEWALKPLANTAELIVSEIVTNAICAAAGLPDRLHSLPTVQLWLSTDNEHMLVEVWDPDERMPVCQHPDPDAEHGRGLFLVEALSEDWGTYRPAGSPGKIVWAQLAQRSAR